VSAAHRVMSIERSLSVRRHFTSLAQQQQSGREAATAAGGPGARTVAQLAAELSRGATAKKYFAGGRFIIFIAGGVSYSEVRALNEVMRASNREVIVGSTHILTPESYVRDLERLGDDERAREFLARPANTLEESQRFFEEDAQAAGDDLNRVLIGGSSAERSAIVNGIAPPAGSVLANAQNGVARGAPPAAEGGAVDGVVEDRGAVEWLMRLMRRVPGLGALARWLDADEVDLRAQADDDEIDDEDANFLRDLGMGGGAGCASCTSASSAVAVPGRAPAAPPA